MYILLTELILYNQDILEFELKNFEVGEVVFPKKLQLLLLSLFCA